MVTDSHWTLAEETRASLRIQRSEFVGIAFPVRDEEGFSARLQRISRDHHDASHHCWAWRFGPLDSVQSRSSDAGEPSGTAGRPILGVLEGAELLDAAIVVVRYFGGIKLGTGGLGRAYRDAAREVIDKAGRTAVLSYERLTVVAPWQSTGVIYRLIDSPNIVLVEERYAEATTFLIDVRRSLVERVSSTLTEARLSFDFTPREFDSEPDA